MRWIDEVHITIEVNFKSDGFDLAILAHAQQRPGHNCSETRGNSAAWDCRRLVLGKTRYGMFSILPSSTALSYDGSILLLGQSFSANHLQVARLILATATEIVNTSIVVPS